MILRVWSIIPKHCRIGWKTVAEAISFGQFLNTFVPARAGDVVKIMVVSKADSENAPVMTCAGFILADKIMDLASIVALVFMSRAYHVATMHVPSLSSKLLWLILPFSLALFLAWRLVPREKLHRFREWADHFRQGLAALRSPRHILLALLFGIAAWSSGGHPTALRGAGKPHRYWSRCLRTLHLEPGHRFSGVACQRGDL